MKSELVILLSRYFMFMVGFFGLLTIWIPKDPSYVKPAILLLVVTFLQNVSIEFWVLRQSVERLRSEIKGERSGN